MSWERDPLWAKARLYFEKAMSRRHDESEFGLWCSLGLELLARSAVASVSPVLLAEPDREQQNVLHALKMGSDRTPRKSIGTVVVLRLCKQLFDGFSQKHYDLASTIINRRNEELHTGDAAFEIYRSKHWVLGFYRICRTLTEAMGESLETLFGEEEARAAISMLEQDDEGTRQRVQSAIAASKKAFGEKGEDEREQIKARMVAEGKKLAYARHHRVACPACGCVATIQGETVGTAKAEMTEHGKIVIREPVSPRTMTCLGCGLKLNSYAELDEAGLGGNYTRTTTTTPEDYYNLVDLETYDLSEEVREFLAMNPEFIDEEIANRMEYDNE